MATALNFSNNPFADDDEEEAPKFGTTKVTLDEPGSTFDLTEFPASFDEGLSLRPASGDSSLDGSTETKIYTDRDEGTVISVQPRRLDLDNTEHQRRQIPVYTLGWSSTTNSQLTPATGLDFLIGVPSIIIQQTVTNLHDANGTEKTYIIKVPHGETLYSGSENSRQFERICLGSQRSFNMSILDHTKQEAAILIRRLACTISWFPGIMQELKVCVPGLHVIGKIKQDFSFSNISFTVLRPNGEEVYRIFGPNTCIWTVPLEVKFSIAGGRGGGNLGVISRQWVPVHGDYNLQINFPASGTPVRDKMLLIGAAFLIEYMFFEHRRQSCLRIC